MKRTIKHLSLCLVVMFIIVIVLIWGALAQKPPKDEWPKTLLIEGMGVGTSAYLVTSAFSEAIRSELGIKCQVTAGTPGPVAATKVGKGLSDLGLANGDPPYCVFHGLDEWEGQPLKNLRILTVVTFVPTQFITWPGTGINSVADLKSKVIMGDRKGARFGRDAVDGALVANGLTRNDVKVVSWQDYNEQVDFIRMKLGDAIFMSSGVGTAPALELDRSIKWKFISFTEKEIESIIKKGPYFVPFTIPAGTYTQQPKEVRCAAVPTVYVIGAGLPDNLVYQLCKILFDKPGRFMSAHKDWGKFDLNMANTARLAPYHAGAVNYFKEKGVWDSELDKWQKEELRIVGMDK